MSERENYYDANRDDDYENRYNRFDGAESPNDSGEHSSQRRRFVRVDSGSRQYSKVERGPRPNGEGQYGIRPRTYRPAGERNYGNLNDSENRGYGQRQRGYDNNGYRSSYNNHGQDSDQPRFYRERVQEGQNDGGYQSRPQYGQRQYDRPSDGQRPYRPRTGNGQQGGYGRSSYGQGGYGENSYGRGNQNRPFGGQPKRKPVQKGKRIEYNDIVHDPDEPIRLNKFLANAGVCSRREADDFIKAGVVKVNGQTVTELGCKVKRGDNVLFHDQLVSIERKIYILLNKPKDCVTTVDDPQERKTVMDYVRNACRERIYPVGRLDRNTTGVLLLTNDGEMAAKLTHPKFMKKKIYHAKLDRPVETADLEKLLTGVDLGEGDMVRADEADYVNDDRNQVGLEIHSGRNRVVRRMFDALGYKVVKLDRVQFAGLTKKRLRRGDWRFLTDKEVNMLRMGAFE